MKTKRKQFVILALGALLMAGCSTIHEAKKWEYQTVSGTPSKSEAATDKVVNDLVAQGWKIHQADFAYVPDVWVSHYLLKRERK